MKDGIISFSIKPAIPGVAGISLAIVTRVCVPLFSGSKVKVVY